MTSDSSIGEKAQGELSYWKEQQQREGTLQNHWYQPFFTDHFGIPAERYRGLRMLDVGCGPRGSLEWATEAGVRIGLDPLAASYAEFGTASHQMAYASGAAEAMPFTDDTFDVVSSFNSLDHVDDLYAAITEIKRVIAIGGVFLLMSDVHAEPTPQEPTTFDWDVVQLFRPELRPFMNHHYEKSEAGLYASVAAALRFDHSDPSDRYGVLSTLFVKEKHPRRRRFPWAGRSRGAR